MPMQGLKILSLIVIPVQSLSNYIFYYKCAPNPVPNSPAPASKLVRLHQSENGMFTNKHFHKPIYYFIFALMYCRNRHGDISHYK